jgi:hypothetical protein
MAQPVAQVVPGLASPVDGVADYARTLGAALDASASASTSFLCADPDDSLGNGPWRERSIKVTGRSPAELVAALERLDAHCALVHYAGYGYSARGCPLWLVSGLERWKQARRGARLVTMFHELYAFGPPWRSSFWLSPVQRALARRLWKITDGAVTNVGRYARVLRRWRPDAERGLSLMPVFSNVGEPGTLAKWSSRRAQLVVFARPDAAERVYGPYRESLLQACGALEIREIIDIGMRTAPVPSRIGAMEVTATGRLPAAEVSAILGRARAGFLHYPSDHLGKSGVFAAYAAHGLVPVTSWRRAEEEPGLADGVSYWAVSRAAAACPAFESIAQRAAAWYAGHRLEVQVREFTAQLRGAAQ